MSKETFRKKYKELIRFNNKFKLWEKGFNLLITNKNALDAFSRITKSPIDWPAMWILSLIANSTYETSTPEKVKFLFDNAIQNKLIKEFESTDNLNIITLNDDSKLIFMRLTDLFEGLEKQAPDLLTEERYGRCHLNSFLISAGLDLPHCLCSGLCSNQSNRRQFLHSWVEFNYNDNTYVIDYTHNAVINKSGYYKLFSPEQVVKIDGNQVQADEKLIRKSKFSNMDIRMYCFFPDEVREEIIKELESLSKENN